MGLPACVQYGCPKASPQLLLLLAPSLWLAQRVASTGRWVRLIWRLGAEGGPLCTYWPAMMLQNVGNVRNRMLKMKTLWPAVMLELSHLFPILCIMCNLSGLRAVSDLPHYINIKCPSLKAPSRAALIMEGMSWSWCEGRG